MSQRKFYRMYDEFVKECEENTLPSMTSTDLYLSTQQRVTNLLHAGQNLLNSRLSPEFFEQNGPVVDESIREDSITDLHDMNMASLKLNKKLSDAYKKVSSLNTLKPDDLNGSNNTPTSDNPIPEPSSPKPAE